MVMSVPSSSPPATAAPYVVEDCGDALQVLSDGTIVRSAPPPAPVPDDGRVEWKDAVYDAGRGLGLRMYRPRRRDVTETGEEEEEEEKLPVLVYFHGGGFCVGSAAWSCYHEFLAQLPAKAGCAVMSVDYRLAPEHRLPSAFDDGMAAVRWLRQQAGHGHGRSSGASDEVAWWRGRCRFDRVFLMGDSAGASIAFHVAARLGQGQLGGLAPLAVKGAILIQPFFGGEARTASEKTTPQPPRSALSLATSDSYWRMALPSGSTRDHPWCNPLSRGAPRLETLPLPPVLVCVAEADILRDRNLELCRALRKAGRSVEQATYGGVGHAFQVLHNYHLSQPRTQEMLAHIRAFVAARSSS